MPRLLQAICASILFCVLSAGVALAAEVDAWRTVFATPQELAAIDEPIVCVLTIQHPEIIRKQLADKPAAEYSGAKLRERVQQQSGLRCVVVHFTEVRGEDLDRSNVKAILITGRSKTVSRDLDAQFHPLIRNTQIPMFGFCGGMQLIGQAYSAKLGPLRKLRDGEKDPNPSYHPGQFKEWGFLPVQIVQRDPLFEGLPEEIVVRQAHAFQMLQVPDEFDLLASSPECKVEAYKHRQRLLYGTQFHPEANDDDHPHGRVILENFFRLAGLGPKNTAGE
ncbi:MAG TPA: gamma-glutamyl-gamma-aminobutyrate hydrolase family protein [Candidatus Anammoximicrobium sp.]|nr:gamma-glutamyl-gamma-aminobutyrate hydrolase family protein [Candidatus Anammoximicrobium sp.]